MTACKNKKKEEPKTNDTTTTTTTTTTTSDNTVTGDVPKFADAEVQKYVDDYTAFVTGFVEAYKSKDMSKISDLSTKAAEWATKTPGIAMKLATNTDEATKFQNYMTKLSKDMSDAVTMMAQGK